MKERPILFSGEMVRAILDGRKTQTRRVVNPQSLLDNKTRVTACYECPYGAPGGHLWVRETWRAVELDSGNDGILYKADNHFKSIENSQAAADLWCDAYADRKHGNKWRPSIFMPRWASRILLEVTDVRVERVQEISDGDAKAEGLVGWKSERSDEIHYGITAADVWETDPRITYKRLWDSINAERGHSWESNPWVWVASFKVVKP